MLDPFPVPSPVLKAMIEPLCEFLHLRTLPLHIHEIAAGFLLYYSIFEYFGPLLSNFLLSTSYSKLSSEGKLRWNMNCTSFIQSLFISILSLYTIIADNERRNMNLEERIWGYTGASGLVQGLSCGYFLFDFVCMIRYLKIFGLPMLVHAVSCMMTYTLGFRPIFNYYCCMFMLYELSTPFLNIHWFFDKMDMTGSKPQLYNGLVLLGTFFSARLVHGLRVSINLYLDMWQAWQIRNQVQISSENEITKYGTERSLPAWLIILFLIGHITLNSLNLYWFNKMVAAVKKRFVKKPTKTE